MKKKILTEKQRGSLGGRSTAKKGKEYMSLIGKRGAEKRWSKLKVNK